MGSAVVLFSIHRHKAAYSCRRSSGSHVWSRGTEFWKNLVEAPDWITLRDAEDVLGTPGHGEAFSTVVKSRC